MILPSKELLNAIFNIEVLDEICFIYAEGNGIKYYIMPKYAECTVQKVLDINEYELAHKVKDWALKQGYRIASQSIERGMTYDIGVDGFAVVYTCNREVRKEREETEPEAIFRAGEWVLGKLNGDSVSLDSFDTNKVHRATNPKNYTEPQKST